MKEELEAFNKAGSQQQYEFIYALMDVTECRKHVGVGWIWRLVAASPGEVEEAAKRARARIR